ncbi:hypothetical protein BTR92_23415 [Salmonella enterica subsp. enterica serovar Enteritidis]|nr:hypothetical protein [Salmonella enterica subsp. enterica serovar Enteritidis]
MCLSFGCSSVFSPSFEGFFFHFFLLLPILPVALANSLTRYRHFHYSIFFSELKCNSDRKGHSAF